MRFSDFFPLWFFHNLKKSVCRGKLPKSPVWWLLNKSVVLMQIVCLYINPATGSERRQLELHPGRANLKPVRAANHGRRV